MGKEEKKVDETKAVEKKPQEPKRDTKQEKKEGKNKEADKPVEKPAKGKKPRKSKDAKEPKIKDVAAPPSPPQEIVLKVLMHCEGCARKVRRSLNGFPGVEEVITDCKSHKVVVKGENLNPLRVLEIVQRKSHSQVELLSPIPKPPFEEEKKLKQEDKPKPQEKKEEPLIVTVLKVHMHCEACAQEIKRRIQRMKGVESVEPNMKNLQVSVKGVYDPVNLIEYVYKRIGKQAVIVNQEPEKKDIVEEPKEAKEEKKEKKKKGKKEKKANEGEKENKKNEGEESKEDKKELAAVVKAKPEEDEEAPIEETKVAEVKMNENFYNLPARYGMEMYAYPPLAYPPYYLAYPQYPVYPPQIFSDENPNACTVM